MKFIEIFNIFKKILRPELKFWLFYFSKKNYFNLNFYFVLFMYINFILTFNKCDELVAHSNWMVSFIEFRLQTTVAGARSHASDGSQLDSSTDTLSCSNF